ncbi:ethylene-responsive transcription factor 13-like [Prunus yedoensis var. nudiflora]|uniref:Ethylene-responsive transcription factor 13-like n=1 Tax=Prunus yedoensis var. nudiflora TaxID=2094558 RepID=A0A314ZQL2_PRUYE|nr:ethylene-responsive transcription factor 13-like [Prunus yedoensis var. nudiflora]
MLGDEKSSLDSDFSLLETIHQHLLDDNYFHETLMASLFPNIPPAVQDLGKLSLMVPGGESSESSSWSPPNKNAVTEPAPAMGAETTEVKDNVQPSLRRVKPTVLREGGRITGECGRGRGGSTQRRLGIRLKTAPGCGSGPTKRLRMRLSLMIEPPSRYAARRLF